MPEPQKAPQADPWAEAAKNYKAQPQGEAAPSGGNEDWKVWQQGGGDDSNLQTGKPSFGSQILHGTTAIHKAIDKAAESEPITGFGSIVNNLGAGAVRAIPQMVAHPFRAIGSMGKMVSMNPADAVGFGMDIVQPESGKSGGEIVANIPQAMLAMAGAGEGEAGSARLLQRNPLPRQYRSPLIPPSEAYARAIVDQLGLPNPAREGAVSTLGKHAPLLRDYLRSEGAGTKPIEIGKAAKNIGEEGTGFYQEHLIDPNQMQETGEGPVGDVYGRVVKNNRLLAPDYRKGLTIETDAGLERKANLIDENKRLNRALYNTVSARSGLSPEDVQGINQRGAEMQNLGDEAQNAQGLRAQGYKPGGTGHIPYSNLDKAMRLVNWFRGGEEAVRGKRIGRLLDQMPGEPTPLPQPEAIRAFRDAQTREELGAQGRELARQQRNLEASQARKPAGMGPTQPPQAEVIEPPPDYARNFVNGIRARAGANRAASVPPPEPPTPRNPMDRFLGAARETQEQARTLRRKQ